MGATWVGRLSAVFGIVLIPMAVRGDQPAAPARAVPTPSAAASAPNANPAPPAAVELANDVPSASVDAAAIRAETTDRLKRLADPAEKSVPANAKELKKLLEERLSLLNDWDEAIKARRNAEHPEPSPDTLVTKGKADLERLKTMLDQAAKDPNALLPGAFRQPANQISDAARAELKDAIDAAKVELRECKAKLDKLANDPTGKKTNPIATLHADRDKIHQRVAALAPRRVEREGALAAAKTADERSLENERLANFEWEARVETERLVGQEAKISLGIKLRDLDALNRQVLDAQVALAAKTLERMQGRYRTVTDRQETELQQEAASEQKRAAKTDDPLERYRARWTARLLELKAQVLKNENALASSPSPSLEEQQKLADDCVTDFENIKQLLDDGRVSHLDALRFNNDFRRIGPQRARIVSHELAASDRQLTYYENALTSAEMDLYNDRRADQYEHETLLEHLPKSRHAEAKELFAEFDRKHEELLSRNRAVLVKLASRAESTHNQVLRRLRTLDDQYGFIRTHIFWVRDQEPIGKATLGQAEREMLVVGKSLFRLALDAGERGRISAEFIAAILALVVLAWPLARLHASLRRTPAADSNRPKAGFSAMWTFLIDLGASAILPSYLGLTAYAARQAPWPRSLALPVSSALLVVAGVALVAGLLRWLFRPEGWAERELRVPKEAACQLRRVVLIVVVTVLPLGLPTWLLVEGLIAPGGRPIAAPALCRFLGLGIELIAWGVVLYLVRGQSALVLWLLQFPERLGWLNRHRRVISVSVLAAVGGVIGLDAFGYSFTASRLEIGAAQGLVLLGFCWILYQMILRLIDQHAWRWIRVGQGTTATGTADDAATPVDLANRLRRLTAYLVPALGLGVAAWMWDVDWALFSFLAKSELWHAETPVTVGDAAKFVLALGLTAGVWRHLSTFFAVAVFPRMRDDPGVRFAVVTLCRYAVLGIGLLSGLSAIHLGLEKIGMVLAALGVGLGFGLQEIVSNFVCGIILLLERPIRVGDVVTVSGMTGKVDRINIRATTIINGDNQSIIVPNRAFITSDLVNWTLKDKIIRVSIHVKVAHGTDPDRVSDLLLNIAREDPDVLRNPLPASFMEDFSDSALNFVLHVHVPDPSLGARVRHRLFAQIQKRFADADIEIPLPMQELRVQPMADNSGRMVAVALDGARVDKPSATPPPPRFATAPPPIPEAVEDCHRGVDE